MRIKANKNKKSIEACCYLSVEGNMHFNSLEVVFFCIKRYIFCNIFVQIFFM